MSPLRAVVVDTDGVLVDSAALRAVAGRPYSAAASKLGAEAGSGHPAQLPFAAEREYHELVDAKPS
ncbi:hypothetical protein ACFV4Q_02870 [Streptomyces nojiriensis]|uniref:hypothetical protein n=1 Tax=Streptomyces nojiriensis TaxID=66374 RepID=UPI00364A93FC